VLKKIVIALFVLVAVIAVIVALQPAEFRIARSATIAAPAPVVFQQVNDFHNWQNWSPWEGRDPAMKRIFDGAPAGAGAVYRWEGNKEVGSGSMTIAESRPNELVTIRLEFLKPFRATSMAEFAFKPDGNRTAVTWSMTGRNNFMAKAVHLFLNMDKIIGDDFERGLAQMKQIAEAPGK